MAVKHFQEAIKLNPNYNLCIKALKRLKSTDNIKKEANEFYNNYMNEDAIRKYTECLEIDKFNIIHNSIIYTNQALAKSRLHEYKSALKDLDRAILLNEKYAKVILLSN